MSHVPTCSALEASAAFAAAALVGELDSISRSKPLLSRLAMRREARAPLCSVHGILGAMQPAGNMDEGCSREKAEAYTAWLSASAGGSN
jgi:hypothetical protein